MSTSILLPDLVTDHVDQGLALLISQYRNKPRLRWWLTAYLNQVQELEQAIFDVIFGRWLDKAVGQQLDVLGKIVKEPRLARLDDSAAGPIAGYRNAIRARIRINRSEGGLQDILDVLGMITATPLLFEEQYPAFLFTEFSNVPDSDPVLLYGYLTDAKLAGVGYVMISPTSALPLRFLPRDHLAPDNVSLQGCGDQERPITYVQDPSLVALTGLWEAPWTGGGTGLWTGLASAGGTSGGQVLSNAIHPPSNGAPLNGKTPPSFDGVAQSLASTAGTTTFLAVTGFTVAVLFKPTATSAPTGSPNTEPAVFSTSDGNMAIEITSSGVKAFIFDGTYKETPNWQPAAAGAWHLAIARYDVVTGILRLRVDDGRDDFVASVGEPFGGFTGHILVGCNGGSTAFFDGLVAAVVTSNAPITDEQCVGFGLFLEQLYALDGITFDSDDWYGFLSDEVTIRNPKQAPYVRPPTIPDVVSVSPNSGPTSGGTLVTVTGLDFDFATAVRLDPGATSSPTNVDDLVILSNTEIQFKTRAYTPLIDFQQNVYVTTPRGTGLLAGGFLYTPPPFLHVDDIAPVHGTVRGGTNVTITGQLFTDAVKVEFVYRGSPTALSFTVISDTTIDAVTPAGGFLPPFGRDLRITLADGTVYTLPNAWTYDPTPAMSISSLVPGNGSMLGGYTVTIVGDHFLDDGSGVSGVSMDLVSVGSFTIVDNQHITFTMPNKTSFGPGPFADPVVASITTPPHSQGYPFDFDSFTLQQVQPSQTSHLGGATITLKGTGLDETTSLKVDGSSTAFTIVDQHTVTFVAPAHAVGTVVIDMVGSVSPDTTGHLTFQ